jgi:hypothetical protein
MLGTLRPATPLRAEVSRNAAGFLVTFGPLPEGVTMASAVLRTGDESFPLNEFDSKREIAGTYWTARTAAKMVVPTSSASTAPTEPWYGPVSIPFTPTPEATAFMGENSALGSLPGTSDRRLAIDTLAEDSGWAVLELSILGPLATLSLQTPNDRPDLWQTSTRTHFRLLVPLAGKEER